MKIAIATETITGGGLAHYTEDLDQALRKFHAPHQYVEGSPFHSPLLRSGSDTRKTLKRIFQKIPFAVRLRNHFRSKPWADAAAWANRWRTMPQEVIAIVPHVVTLDDGMLNDYYAAIAERQFVLVIHDLHALHYPELYRAKDIEYMKARFGLLSRKAGSIVVHNEFTAQDVVERLGVDRERISVVLLPAFFSEANFTQSPETDRSRLASIGIQPPYALWASSSTSAHKNHLNLLKAWRLLLNRGCQIQLVCTGSREPHWPVVAACIEAEHLDSAVCFTGIIGDADLAAVMRNAHLAICPTLFEGGGPGPAAEAMMAGIPLTVSNIPQCRELFNMRTDLCTFFDPYDPAAIADAIQKIMGDYKEAQHRAVFAREQYATMRTQKSAAGEYWQAVEKARQRVEG